MRKKAILLVTLLSLFVPRATATDDLDKTAVKAIMKRVADWQIAHPNTQAEHDDLDWTHAALYIGMLDWAELAEKEDADDSYYQWLLRIGKRNQFQMGKWMYHADFIAVGQPFIDLYIKYGNKKMIEPVMARANWVVEHTVKEPLALDYSKLETLDRWSWCDALFMAPPVYAKLYALTCDNRYLQFLNSEYRATYHHLFDKEEHLFYRDRRYFDKREANGQKVFWGRGNGWVLGGLAEILQALPWYEPSRAFYKQLFIELATRVATLQSPDGYWHASLLDPASYPSPETSATGFIVYALAYGVNEGLLDCKTFLPVIQKGWQALVDAVEPDGKLGYVQPIGADPRKVTREMTEVYGVGAFLLAGCQIYKMKPATSEQPSDSQELTLKYGADRLGKRQDAAMRQFRDNRLGAFIHWGLYAIPGGEWDGKVYPGAAEWLKSWAKVPAEEWLKLMELWNPQHFDAKAWAKMHKKMGVKYVKITTKHHEGFCLWPSQYTPYTVANTPYKRDILGELVKAYNEEGIDVHFYFSVMDWSHPDYRYDIKSPEDKAAFERFLEFTDNQLKELATRYPTVKDFWFDGTWDASIKKNGWWTAHVEQMLKELLPGVTINSRLRADDYGKRHFDSNGHLMGDYESGYERRLPDPVKDLKVTQWDWEACMTVPENQWGYHKDWSLSYVKTPVEVLERIVHAVSMGGNMVVNFGPQPDGDFRPEEKALAEAIGQWMRENGECIYGCDYAGWEKQSWGYYTRRANDVYMVVFNPPYSKHLLVKTPKETKLLKANLLNGKPLPLQEIARDEYHVDMPTKEPGAPFIIKLQIADHAGATDKYKEALT